MASTAERTLTAVDGRTLTTDALVGVNASRRGKSIPPASASMEDEMDVAKLEELAAAYMWHLRRKADKVASEADFQNGRPIEVAKEMRRDADAVENTLTDFIIWVAKRKG